MPSIYVIKNRRLNKAYVGLTENPMEARMGVHKGNRNSTNSSAIISLPDTEILEVYNTPSCTHIERSGYAALG